MATNIGKLTNDSNLNRSQRWRSLKNISRATRAFGIISTIVGGVLSGKRYLEAKKENKGLVAAEEIGGMTGGLLGGMAGGVIGADIALVIATAVGAAAAPALLVIGLGFVFGYLLGKSGGDIGTKIGRMIYFGF